MTHKLSPDPQEGLLKILKNRFEKNMDRHLGVEWKSVQEKLLKNPEKMWSLSQMEETGGEPDILMLNEDKDEFVFVDCSPESPSGRRSLCYDDAALEARKVAKPKGSALGMAREMGIEMLDEEHYQSLQKLGKFDLKSSSWILTPELIRKLGGALFTDRRYDHVFVYHNGADSYYAARGFRGLLRI